MTGIKSCITVENFFRKFSQVNFKKNEVILRAEEKPSSIYYLTSGFVKQYMLSPKGSTFIINLFAPKTYFLMHWALNGAANPFYFEAVTPVCCYSAPIGTVKEFFEKNPQMLLDFTKRMLKGTFGLLNRLETLMMDNAYVKTVELLLYLAHKFGSCEGHKVIIQNHFTHKELSSWLGVTRETASLQMESLKRKELISYKRRLIVISDLDKLKQESTLSH